MASRKNPFTPTFGQVPLALAGRRDLIADVVEGLENAPGDPNRATIFVGARGTGKTVLLTTLAEAAEDRGWISANVSAREGMLEECLEQVNMKRAELLPKERDSHITSIQAAGFGLSRELDERKPTTWRHRVSQTVASLNERGIGVLFTIDEVSASEAELKRFVDTYQHFIREHRNVALLLAGLPSRISSLLLDEDVTFLRRAFRHELGAIAINEVAQAMLETVEGGNRTIDQSALMTAAEGTAGYAYLIQLVGYYMWRAHPESQQISLADVDMALAQAQRQMDHSIFETTLLELSGREREYLRSMAMLGSPCSTASVAKAMGISANNASNVRRRLIERGIIGRYGTGYVTFAMPMLADYLMRTDIL